MQFLHDLVTTQENVWVFWDQSNNQWIGSLILYQLMLWSQTGFEKSTRPLAFASALPGRASRILASLARPGERFPPGPKW